MSLSEPIDTDKEGQPLTLLDVLADNSDLAETVDVKIGTARLATFLRDDTLSPREKEIICKRYGIGCAPLAQREVAKQLKISRSYVSRIETKALSKLRARFEGK